MAVRAGDSHNFGRHVVVGERWVHKPRAILWEWLVLSAESPLRTLLAEAATRDGLGALFDFLPDLAFTTPEARDGGQVERVVLEPLPETLPAEQRRELARIVGRALALFAWLGVSDLHWENLVIGAGARGQVVFAPLDVEMILGDFGLPTETKLLPDPDPEYAAVCQHACGVRRVLPWLGKPVDAGDLVAMAAAYRAMLAFLDRHAAEIAAVFTALPALATTPIRVCLRGTEEYVRARAEPLWPPLLAAESEQLARGDIPYFFRLHGARGIHWFADASLTEVARLPLEGDVPQLDPILPLARALRGKHRKKLREEGLFTVIGAFDHPSLKGRHEEGSVAVTFQARTLIVEVRGQELEARRDLSAFVSSVYLPCRCGEVTTPFVPPVTVCDAPR